MRSSSGTFALAACWLFVVAVIAGSSIAASTDQITIKAGDTFWIIANRYGTTPAAIEAVNPGIVPSNLQIGQVINLPSEGTAVAQDSVTSNTVVQNALINSSPEGISSSLDDETSTADSALPTFGANILSNPDSQLDFAASTNPAALNPEFSTSEQGSASAILTSPSIPSNPDESGVTSAASGSGNPAFVGV